MRYVIIAVAILVAAVSSSPAQDPPKHFVVDEAGLWQWKPFKAGKCTDCTGRRAAPAAADPTCQICRLGELAGRECPVHGSASIAVCGTCAGAGKVHKDPVKYLPCPQCRVTGKFTCEFCNGKKKARIQGGKRAGNKCMCCSARGHFKCSLCNGKKFVPVPRLGSFNLPKARAKDLEKAIDRLEEARLAMRGAGSGSTDGKKADDYAKRVKPFKSTLPAGVIQAKGLRRILKSMAKGQAYTSHHGNVAKTIAAHRSGLLDLIDAQKTLYEAALKRVRHNEAVGKKGGGED